MDSPAPRANNEDGQVIAGVVLAFGLHLLLIPLAILAGVLSAALGDEELALVLVGGAILLIGVSQLIYQVPVAIYLWRTGRRALLKGLIIGAALTFLLNAACWGLVVGTFSI